MDVSEIFSRIDHTALAPTAKTADIYRLCDEAIKYGAASVCIPPSFVARVKDRYGSKLTVCTVIGFPLGYSTKETKIAELIEARKSGASEFDMVINVADIKDGAYDKVKDEIAALKSVAGDLVLKVIVETCYLSQEEKLTVCRLVTEAGADYIKTSTGFGSAGAALDDVRLFRENVGEGVKIKAAGGIRTKEDMEAFIAAGADRIGSSSGAKLF